MPLNFSLVLLSKSLKNSSNTLKDSFARWQLAKKIDCQLSFPSSRENSVAQSSLTLRKLQTQAWVVFELSIILHISWRMAFNFLVEDSSVKIKRVISSQTLRPSRSRFKFTSIIRRILFFLSTVFFSYLLY